MEGLIFSLLLIGYVDSSKIDISFPYKKIKISNTNGSVNVEYIPSDKFSYPYLIVKKKAEGKKEKFEEWAKKVKIEMKESADFYEIEVKFPSAFKEVDNQRVELSLFLPYTLDYLEIHLNNGSISTKNFVSQKYKIINLNGKVNVEEIKGKGEIKVNNGSINFEVSHNEFFDVELEVLNGSLFISASPFTQIYPEVINGKISGDLFFEKSDVFQKIRCKVNNGDIKIKRDEVK